MNINRITLTVVFGFVTVCSGIALADESIVMTDRGPVRGTSTPTLRKFLGIPYAAPPVGKLRWRPPRNHVRWSAPLDATRFGNHCPQGASIFGVASSSEDCLFLNIFTTNNKRNGEKSSSSSPVMVWIHGGALTVGLIPMSSLPL